MTSNMAVFERVAAREITPEEGAQIMLDAELEARKARRPKWAPRPVWVIAAAVIGIALAMLGVERNA